MFVNLREAPPSAPPTVLEATESARDRGFPVERIPAMTRAASRGWGTC
jgi:hypothetical protein